MNYWLLKSEPTSFSIDDLVKAPKQSTGWDGVRNFQARNFLRDEMKKGDQAFFYHSSCDVPGIVGIVTVTKEGYPDPTAFDKKHHHYDEESDPKNPRWYMIDIKLDRKLKRAITLDELKQHANGKLKDLLILKRGNRLSVTPVTKSDWQFITSLE
jgi:predicted RNA-binding protein with PUA-like domain